MTQEIAKHRCKDLLTTLLRLDDSEQRLIRNLVQDLINGVQEPESFMTKLQGGNSVAFFGLKVSQILTQKMTLNGYLDKLPESH